MEHVITLDIDAHPELRALPSLEGLRAGALFVSHTDRNGAFRPGTRETAVLLLTDADLAAGEPPGGEEPTHEGRAVRVHHFAVPLLPADAELTARQTELVALVERAQTVAGEPAWIQGRARGRAPPAVR